MEELIFYTLDRSVKAYRQLAQSRLSRLGITVDQWLVLNMLKQNPRASQQEISEKVFKDTASVTRIIELLVKKGYLRRESSVQDRRRSVLVISATGKKLMSSAVRVAMHYRKEALKGITPRELALAQAALVKISANCSLRSGK